MPRTSTDLQDGVVVGTIAYAVIAATYGLLDLVAGRGLFFTVNLLGLATFGDAAAASAVTVGEPIRLGAVLLFNALHLVVSIGVGVVVVALVGYAEREDRQAFTVLLALVSGYAVTVAAVGWLSADVRDMLPWTSIILANALAVGAGGWYVVWQRPGVIERMIPSKHG